MCPFLTQAQTWRRGGLEVRRLSRRWGLAESSSFAVRIHRSDSPTPRATRRPSRHWRGLHSTLTVARAHLRAAAAPPPRPIAACGVLLGDKPSLWRTWCLRARSRRCIPSGPRFVRCVAVAGAYIISGCAPLVAVPRRAPPCILVRRPLCDLCVREPVVHACFPPPPPHPHPHPLQKA